MRRLIALILTALPLAATEPLSEQALASHLTEANPFYYTAVGRRYLAETRRHLRLGAFDAVLTARYDDKRYPASEGKLIDVSASKPLGNGIEFLVGYRRAEGVQEYNNIKTGDDGEVLAGVKVPVFSALHAISERQYALENAELDAEAAAFETRDTLRLLQATTRRAYYTVLYQKALLELEATLLATAQTRYGYIEKRTALGDLPEVARMEARRQVIDREQRRRNADNAFRRALALLLKLLDLSGSTFEARYHLPPLPAPRPETRSMAELVDLALAQRADLQVLRVEKRRRTLDARRNAPERYPKLDVALYGVHDFKYDEGFKVSVSMQFPVERRYYEGKQAEILQSLHNLDAARDKTESTLRADLARALQQLETLEANAASVDEELTLLRQLEAAEIKKYRLGAGDLFRVNQRELQTLLGRQKALGYRLQHWLTRQDLDETLGEYEG